jgi:hypothetical protein
MRSNPPTTTRLTYPPGPGQGREHKLGLRWRFPQGVGWSARAQAPIQAGTAYTPSGADHLQAARVPFAGLAIGYVFARSLNRLTGRDGRNEMAVDVPPGSEAERQWRARVSGLEGTSRTALQARGAPAAMDP